MYAVLIKLYPCRDSELIPYLNQTHPVTGFTPKKCHLARIVMLASSESQIDIITALLLRFMSAGLFIP